MSNNWPLTLPAFSQRTVIRLNPFESGSVKTPEGVPGEASESFSKRSDQTRESCWYRLSDYGQKETIKDRDAAKFVLSRMSL